MVILQTPNHFLRWYGMVLGLVAFAGTAWLLHRTLGSYTPGVLIGVVLFFVVWFALVVIHAPFAVKLGVDVSRRIVRVGAQEFPFNDVLGLAPTIQSAGDGARMVEVTHELRVDGYSNPIVLHPAKAKRRMDRSQLEAYEEFLTRLDFGPQNPVVKREQHRNADEFGTEAGQRHPLDDEVARGQAVVQLRGLLADQQFQGGLAPEGFDDEAPGQPLDFVQPHYRDELPELFGDDVLQPSRSVEARRRREGTLEQHRSVVRGLGQQIQQRTARLRRLRRVFGWTLGIGLSLLFFVTLLSTFEALPAPVDDAVTLTVVLTLLVTIIVAMLHSFLFDLHVRAVRREADRLMAPPSSAAQSAATLAQHWWSLYEQDKDPEWSTTTGSAAVDPRDPQWNPEEVVMESGAIPDVLATAWLENPRRSMRVLTFSLGAAAAALLVIGLETGAWPWYLAAGLFGAVGIGTWIRADRNKAHQRRDLREFAHRLDALRRTGGTQVH